MQQWIHRVSSDTKSSFLFIYLLYFISHIFFISLPPKGTHIWRQCNTSAVARNFVEEDMNIFKPRVDRRRNKDGVTGMQFPSFEYSVALVSKLVGGYHEAINRIVAFIFFGIGIFYFYKWSFLITSSKVTSFWTTFVFSWCPLLYYHAISALPDILALSSSIAALYYFYAYDNEQKRSSLLLLFASLTLASLTKLQFVMVGIPMAVITIQRFLSKTYTFQHVLTIGFIGFSAAAIAVSWYVYADHLIETSGLIDFGLKFNTETNLANALQIIKMNLLEVFPELLLGYASLVAFIYFLVKSKNLKRPFSSFTLPYTLWLIGMLGYHFTVLSQMQDHMYYMFPYLPLLLLVTGIGLSKLLKKQPKLIYVFLLLIPASAIGRVFHHWTNTKKTAISSFYAVDRNKLEAVVPEGKLAIVGPDATGCVFHYFTHTKGFTFETQQEMQDSSLMHKHFQTYLNEGADYFVLGNGETPIPEIQKFLSEPIYKEKGLSIYKIIKE